MSSTRRTGGEIHLLAMLDGHGGRRLARRLPAWPRLFWYGGATALACALLASLVWLVRTSQQPTKQAPEAAGMAAIRPAHDAVVHDTVEPAPIAAGAMPPAQATVIDVAASTPAAPAHAGPATNPHVAEPVARAPSSPLETVMSRFVHRGGTQPSVRAPSAVRAAPTSATTLTHGDMPQARPKRQPGASKPTTAPPVDTDVALITAIIQHANARNDDAAPACSDHPCGPRMPNEQ